MDVDSVRLLAGYLIIVIHIMSDGAFLRGYTRQRILLTVYQLQVFFFDVAVEVHLGELLPVPILHVFVWKK